MTQILSFRIVEITQQLFAQLDQSILQYYQQRWPTELQDFLPVTSREPTANFSPLQLIADAYTIVKLHSPNKPDVVIISAIVLFFYSTVVLEYYVLREAEHYNIYLQQKYRSADNTLLVSQDNQIFRVNDSSTASIAQTRLLELHKVVLPSTYPQPRFSQMQPEERKEALMNLSNQMKDGSLSYQTVPHRYFLKNTDKYKFIWSLSEDPEDPFCKTKATVDGFFSQFQNKEINTLLFQIASQEEQWAQQIRRIFHGMDPAMQGE
jgi:hypothetical protein